MIWLNDHRPGYFGRTRDAKVKALDESLGKGNWRLAWVLESAAVFAGQELLDAVVGTATGIWPNGVAFEFEQACKLFYEESYWLWLKGRPADLDFICSHGECIDNAESNTKSGCDYLVQESFSTHIQDIAVRNVLRRLGRKFEGPAEKLLVIRSADSNGFKFGPGNVPFMWPKRITQPSKVPKWANAGSVEDFWQSNKWVQIRGADGG